MGSGVWRRDGRLCFGSVSSDSVPGVALKRSSRFVVCLIALSVDCRRVRALPVGSAMVTGRSRRVSVGVSHPRLTPCRRGSRVPASQGGTTNALPPRPCVPRDEPTVSTCARGTFPAMRHRVTPEERAKTRK